MMIYIFINPKNDLDEARSAILQEYLSVYCYRDTRHSLDYRVGETAILSRLTIKAGIGEIALAEYAKCKIWVGG
jgi:hypothetical protein